jgi:hypothetical protein
MPRGRLRLQTDSRFVGDIERFETRTTLEGQIEIGPRNGLRIQAGQLQIGGQHASMGELSLIHYF